MSILDEKKTRGVLGFAKIYMLFSIVLLLFIVALEFVPQDTSLLSDKPAALTPVVATTTLSIPEVSVNPPSAQEPSTKIALPIHPPVLTPIVTSAPVVKVIVPSPSPSLSNQQTLVPVEIINQSTRAALVNIICTAKNSGVFMPVSGSGVIIDPRGIILTNAHLANIYLLKDYPTDGFVECVIRTGSPAHNSYRAELLYISSAWVKANARSIIEENPTGTGENDFALLRITQTISGVDPLPEKFPFIPYELEENSVVEGQDVLVVGYPASFLGGITIQKDLHITSTISKITKLYTFDQNGLLDLISVGTSILSQKGSSGGAVVRHISNKLTGLIVTSTSGETTGERELNAITISHIDRSIKSEMNLDLQAFLKADVTLTARDFQKIVAPELTEILIDVVEK